MRGILIVAILALVACASTANAGKVVGGIPSVSGRNPFICAMRRYGSFICGGSLIGRRHYLTAAHCTTVLTASAYRIDCGYLQQNNFNTPWYQAMNVARVINHPGYNAQTLKNDISILVFTADITIHNTHVEVIAICTGSIQSYIGRMGTASGWGTLTSGGQLATTLMEVTMPIMDYDYCHDNHLNMITDATQVCVGSNGNNQDTCQGDSGGPVSVVEANNVKCHFGITSWGYGCGDGGVYTRTEGFKDWINTQLQSN